MLFEGICFLLSGWGFLTFDFFRHLGEDLTEETFNAFSYVKGLVLAAVAFIAFGLLNIFLDGNLKYGMAYIIASIGLLIYSNSWLYNVSWLKRHYYVIVSVCLLLIFCGFLGIAVFSILNNGYTPLNISSIIFGIGFVLFQIVFEIRDYGDDGTNNNDDFTLLGIMELVGGILFVCGSVLLGGGFFIEGACQIGIYFKVNTVLVAGANSISSFITSLGAISNIITGIGVFGLMVGLGIGGNRGRNKDRNIIAAISYIVLGIGFVGLSLVDVSYSVNRQESLAFFAFTLGLIFGVIGGVNFIQWGRGLLARNEKLALNNVGGAFFGYFGYFAFTMRWYILNDIILATSAVLFASIMIILLLFHENRRVILVGFPIYAVVSLLFGGFLISRGICIFL